MNDKLQKNPPTDSRRVADEEAQKQPKAGPRVDTDDPVEEASYESFPASDPPSFTPTKAGPPSKKSKG
jgi:hypothetical protein